MKKTNQILIVDSFEINRAILEEIFSGEFSILEAVSGAQGAALLRQENRIALVFLSPDLLSNDSMLVLDEMKQSGILSRVPLVLMLGNANAPSVEKFLQAGAWELIQKPFNPGIIRRRISHLLELGRLEETSEAEEENWRQTLVEQLEAACQSDYIVFDLLGDVLEFGTEDAGGHNRRIRLMTRLLMRRVAECGGVSLDENEIRTVSMAAVMHDIGKIMVPRELLEKPGRLTKEEYEQVQRHVLYGEQLLREMGFLQSVKEHQFYFDICRWHHERYDGSGYPDGLKGAEIPIWAQVVGLADCYDTLVNKRVYKPAYDHKRAVEMIARGERGSFSPFLLDILRQSEDELYRIVQENGLLLDREEDVGQKVTQEETLGFHISERVRRLFQDELLHYQEISDLSQDITFEWKKSDRTLRFSQEFSRIFGMETIFPESLIAVRIRSLIEKKDGERLSHLLHSLSPDVPNGRIQIRMIRPSGQACWYEALFHSIWRESEGGYDCIRCIGKLSCIDERKRQISRLKDEATKDFLTGLWSRGKMEHSVWELVKKGEAFAFFYMDVDHFKQVNDQRGHPFGDQFLKMFAEILKKNLRTDDIIARVGGDEFVAVLRGVREEAVALQKARQLSEQFRTIPDIDGVPGRFSGSIGIALFPEDGQTLVEIADRADRALYSCKNDPDRRFARYTDGMRKKPDENP